MTLLIKAATILAPFIIGTDEPPPSVEHVPYINEDKAQIGRLKREIERLESEIEALKSIDTTCPKYEFEATAYTANCRGCIGITKTGIDVRQTIYHEGRRIVAVDPNVIALGSILRITLADGSTFEAVAADTGGAIKGRKLDVLVSTYDEAIQFGRQTVTVEILTEGER